jgi:hypothetical protein
MLGDYRYHRRRFILPVHQLPLRAKVHLPFVPYTVKPQLVPGELQDLLLAYNPPKRSRHASNHYLLHKSDPPVETLRQDCGRGPRPSKRNPRL